MTETGFRERIHQIVKLVPRGKVVTYGQVSAMAGMPRAARAVGHTAHWGDPAVPWQRVVNRNGRVAPGWPGGMPGHAAALRAENVPVGEDWTVDLKHYRWVPDEKLLDKLKLPPQCLDRLAEIIPFEQRAHWRTYG